MASRRGPLTYNDLPKLCYKLANKGDALAALSCLQQRRLDEKNGVGTPLGMLEMAETAAALQVLRCSRSARSLRSEMKKRFGEGNNVYFNCLLKAMARWKMIHSVKHIFNLMEKEEIELKSTTLELLASLHIARGDLEDAETLLAKEPELLISRETLFLLLREYEKAGDFRKAESAIARSKLADDPSAKAKLMEVYIEAGRINKAVKIYNDIVPSAPQTDAPATPLRCFLAMMKGYIRGIRKKNALQVAHRMRKLRVRPSVKILQSIDEILSSSQLTREEQGKLFKDIVAAMGANHKLLEFEVHQKISSGRFVAALQQVRARSDLFSKTDQISLHILALFASGQYEAAVEVLDSYRSNFDTRDLLFQVLDIVERRGNVKESLELVARLEQRSRNLKYKKWTYHDNTAPPAEMSKV